MSNMNLQLLSQPINIHRSNPSSSLLLIPSNTTHKNNPKFITTIKAQSAGNGDHLQKTSIKTPQQNQSIKKRPAAQSPPIGLWDRFPTARTVQQMMDTMERLMEDPPYNNIVSRNAWGPSSDSTTSYSRGRTPWEIKEGDQDYKLRFDMPGMTKEDVKVWVEEKMLVLKAEKLEKNSNGDHVEGVDEEEWSAKSYGKYSFRIVLPENIQFEKIKAEVRDGVLYVVIPKAPVSSKVLDINVG